MTMERSNINLSKELLERLKQSAQAKNKDVNEFIEEVLDQYLYLKEMNEIREEMESYARKSGFYSEEDVFKHIS